MACSLSSAPLASFACWRGRSTAGPSHYPTCRDPSFDHLVGALLKMQRHVEAERLGGLEVDHQLVLDRRLHRQVCRLLTLEDAIDVTGRTPKIIGQVRSVG